MAEEIDISVNAKVRNGPIVSFSTTLEVDAYDKIEVTVTAGGTETVQLIPAATNTVKCAFIQPSRYGNDLSYQVNGAGASLVLDKPQSFIGQGSIDALDSAAPPATLLFDNSLSEDVDIQILVGRSAV